MTIIVILLAFEKITELARGIPRVRPSTRSILEVVWGGTRKPIGNSYGDD